MADQFLAAIFGHEDAAAELAGASEEQWDGVEEGTDELDEALELGLHGEEDGAGGDADAGLSWDATPEEVVRRIHSVTLWFLDQLRAGSLPDIDLASRSGGSRRGSEEDEYADDVEDDGGAGGSGEAPARRLQRQPQQRRTLSLVGRHPESADTLARLFLLLAAVQEQLLAGAQATQRELWYRLKTLEVFRTPKDVADATQDAVSLLRVPRSALGITASSKGLVAGRLAIFDQRAGTETDCASVGGHGVQIPGDTAHITRNYSFASDAQLILVIEKDAIFQRLAEERFFDHVPCILVTGKGVPDLATRALLSCLSDALPELPVVGLVDWNPSGANILSIYRFGSQRMSQESSRYALPSLGWLGARHEQLRGADDGAFQELTRRDRSLAANLSAALRSTCPDWAAELQQMLSSGCKAEIEALYTLEGEGGAAGFADFLARSLEEGDWV